MGEYLVRWEINADGDDPIEAAQNARRAQEPADTSAVVFQVRPKDDPLEARWVLVDLHDTDHTAVQWKYGHKALFEMARKMVADGGDVDAVLEVLEKPWKWPELLSAATLDSAFNAVSPGEDILDVSLDDEPEKTYRCEHCHNVVYMDDKGPMSSGLWYTRDPYSTTCEHSRVGYHAGREDSDV